MWLGGPDLGSRNPTRLSQGAMPSLLEDTSCPPSRPLDFNLLRPFAFLLLVNTHAPSQSPVGQISVLQKHPLLRSPTLHVTWARCRPRLTFDSFGFVEAPAQSSLEGTDHTPHVASVLQGILSRTAGIEHPL